MTDFTRFREYLHKTYGEGPYTATDSLIELPEYGNQVALIERKYAPHGLAIPGGFYERGITLEENAQKEAEEETGLEFEILNTNLPRVLSEPGQDPRAHITSNLFYGIGTGKPKVNPKEDAKSVSLYTINDLQNLVNEEVWAFEHHRNHMKWYLDNRDMIKQGYIPLDQKL